MNDKKNIKAYYLTVSNIADKLRKQGLLIEDVYKGYKRRSNKFVWIFLFFPVLAYLSSFGLPFRDGLLIFYLVYSIYYYEFKYLKPHKIRYILYSEGKETDGTVLNVIANGRTEKVHYSFTKEGSKVINSEEHIRGTYKKGHKVKVLYEPTFYDKINCIFDPKLASSYNMKQVKKCDRQVANNKQVFIKKCKDFLSVIIICYLGWHYLLITFGLFIYPKDTAIRIKTNLINALPVSESFKVEANKERELRLAIRKIHSYRYKGLGSGQNIEIARHEGINTLVEHGVDGANVIADAIFKNEKIRFPVPYNRRTRFAVDILSAKYAIMLIVDKMSPKARNVLKERLNSPPSDLSAESKIIVKGVLEKINK